MSDAVKQLIGYLLMFGVLLGILRFTCTKPKRDNVVPIRKNDGGDAA